MEGASSDHLWSERYDRELGDVFELQDDVAREVTVALQTTLDVAQLAAVIEQLFARDPDHGDGHFLECALDPDAHARELQAR